MNNRYRDIEIKGFRNFDYLKITHLAPVNVFIGANNVGKTSILEAVFMLSGMSNPLMPIRINYWRKLNTATVDEARYLFHNLNLHQTPELKANMHAGMRKLALTPVMTSDTGELSSDSAPSPSTIKQLNIDFGTEEGEDYSFHTAVYTDVSGTLRQLSDSNSYQETMRCLFIPSDKNDSNAISNFALLVKRNKKDEIIRALRHFDPAIESIEALPDGLYLKMEDVQELLPVSMAGDGIRRIINILSSIANEDYHIVLIDEIDNGLHYSAHKFMWKTILEFVKQRRIQLFITTHNIDCLQGLKNALQENEALRESVHTYNIARTRQNGFQAYEYNYSELKEAIDNEIEIRR